MYYGFVLAIVAVCWFAPVLLLARIVRSPACSLTRSFPLSLTLSRPFILFIAIDIYSRMYGRGRRCCCHRVVLTFLFLFWHKRNAISGIAELCEKKTHK